MEHHAPPSEIIPHKKKRNPWVLVGESRSCPFLLCSLTGFVHPACVLLHQELCPPRSSRAAHHSRGSELASWPTPGARSAFCQLPLSLTPAHRFSHAHRLRCHRRRAAGRPGGIQEWQQRAGAALHAGACGDAGHHGACATQSCLRVALRLHVFPACLLPSFDAAAWAACCWRRLPAALPEAGWAAGLCVPGLHGAASARFLPALLSQQCTRPGCCPGCGSATLPSQQLVIIWNKVLSTAGCHHDCLWRLPGG